VLWVDPDPASDAFEISRLQEEGARVDVARTLDEASAAIGRQPFDVVVAADADPVVLAGLRQRTASTVVAYGPAAPAATGADRVAVSSLELFDELGRLGIGRRT
jgi:hypothetical protein